MREERYFWINFLNLYFSKIGTIEFRAMEGSVNSTKILIWLLTCASILRYAENTKACLSSGKVTLKEVLASNVGDKYADYIMEYYKHRESVFFKSDGTYRDHKSTEARWFNQDSEFKFEHNNMEIK